MMRQSTGRWGTSWMMGLLVAAGAGIGSAPATAQQITWEGSVRPRAETRDVDGADSPMFTGMQTRLSLSRALSTDARLFIQVQDVRLWGEEQSTREGSADAFDLHQGYFELGHRGASPLWVRAGRQEIEFAEGRLVGIPEWSHFSQSFDGVRAAWAAPGNTTVDFFGIQLRESESAALASDAALFGVWTETRLGEGRTLQFFALHDRDEASAGTARTTVGSYYAGRTGVVRYRLQGAYQAGEVDDLDVGAYFVGARVGSPLFQGRGDVTLWVDHYSGDADPAAGETGAFSDLFGRNHRFLGFADLFSEIPDDTGGRGLQDLALKLGWMVSDEGRLGLDVHRFLAADDAGLPTGTLADEVDLTLSWPVMGGVDLLAGGSWVSLADGGEALGIATGDVLFGFLQVTAGF